MPSLVSRARWAKQVWGKTKDSLETWRWGHAQGQELASARFRFSPDPLCTAVYLRHTGDTFPPCSKTVSAHLGTNKTNSPMWTAHHQCSIALYGLKYPLELHLLLPRGKHGAVQGILEVPDRGSHEFRPQSERKHSQSFCFKVFFAIAHPCLPNNL